MSDAAASVEGLQRGLAELRLRFASRAVEQAAALEEIAAAGSGCMDRDALSRLAHSLAGACGTFGFPAASEVAGRLEDAVADDKPDADIRDLAGTTADRVREMIGGIRAGRGHDGACATLS